MLFRSVSTENAAVLEEGSANQSRPIEASNGGFVISTPGGATENIGKISNLPIIIRRLSKVLVMLSIKK